MHSHRQMREHGIRQHSERVNEIRREHPDEAADKALITKAVHEHEAHDHPGKKPTRLKFADGGHVEGGHHRGDRARGGRGRHGSHVNVIVAPGQGPARPVPVPVPAAGVGPAPAPRPPMGPPMAGPPMGGGMPPGGPMNGRPMMPMRTVKRGGRLEHHRRHRDEGGMAEAGEPHGEGAAAVHMTAGAMSGEGRLQKARLAKGRGAAAGD